ncbi:HAD-IC family P-type ATPase [Pseudoduganella sp. DS3]|uniref:HAD-IC family P-type ATPase n=1 Tax=Pseudoduganella guangdongensis TaxID=2692179 RepID=A0A6N9HI29_9BURK|nr:cation-translocating P-type ATPase [Pseudoduganella guangdongensis]MYN03224.1 HAD-IC family P-type ATPase [Pseudoduganella guangdongensis]
MANEDLHGLSSAQARQRLEQDGPNSLPAPVRRLPQLLWRTASEPMFLLLLCAAGLYLALGDWLEGLVLLAMVGLTIGLTLFQEGKTERALQALRDLSSPRALVWRDGRAQRIAGSELVRGDLLLLAEGDRVAADAVLLRANNLRVDESLLTGEAWAVGKQATLGEPGPAAPGGDGTPYLWSGTMVLEGDGVARVTATGAGTELGKIGRSLQGIGAELSPLQRESGRMIRLLALCGIAISVLVGLLYGWRTGAWMPAILAGIALSMSLLPEEFPVILTVFPAIGAWRLARAQVLTRRLAAIEALGAITVLCTDKTGTLTQNRMRVGQLYAAGALLQVADGAPLPEGPLAELALFAALASKQRPSDPMELALHAVAGAARQDSPLREYPLAPTLRAMTLVWDDGAAGATVAAKGAPEAIAALCRLAPPAMAQLRAAADQMAAQGLRVLAVARAAHAPEALPQAQDGFAYTWLGLVGLADPLRAEVPEAIGQCHAAGIRVLMITGDYPVTAASIARQAGLPGPTVLNGDTLDALDDAALRRELATASVCARISPLQKLRIVEALKANGEVVAMTGDGVNDAPALKAAHVGIAMGQRGTDVAREAAALVLLDDNFASIVRGIRLGRRIFANMRSAMCYVLAIHVPIAGMALLPALLGWPVLLYPMHIAFLELIIDPACSLAFENEASDAQAMRQPPRRVGAPLLAWPTVLRALLQGAVALSVAGLAYAWAQAALPEPTARATGFAVLVLANLALIFTSLARRRSVLAQLAASNRAPLLVAGVALATLLLVLYLPPVAGAFQFGALGLRELGVVLGCGALCLAGSEAINRAAALVQRQEAKGKYEHPQS